MDTILATTQTSEVERPPEVVAAMEEVRRCWKEGRTVPREVAAILRTHSRKLMQATFERHGLLDIGVPAIRELRGELPE